MAATNIFYRIPTHRGTRVASIAGTECTLDQFCNHIFDTEGLNRRHFIVASGTKIFRPSSCNLQSISLQNNSNVDILIPLLGGKGGFGSLLRAIGAQIEKTTNRDACRDLSGRRLRDIKRQEELKKLIELKAALEEERKRRKKEKLERLRKNSDISKESASIQELVNMFDDHAFNKRRLELGDIIDAAVEKGLINSKKRLMEQAESEKNKKARLDGEASHELDVRDGVDGQSGGAGEKEQAGSNSPVDTPQVKFKQAKVEISGSSKRAAVSKRKDLWLGLDDEELNGISEEEDTEATSVVAV